MKTLEFECDDRYEAEKLASLVSIQKDDTVWVTGVEAVIGNEIVIQLKDRSSHAVLLKDEQTVMRLKSFLRDVLGGQIKIQSSSYLGSVTGITILD
jgi:Xaa-Pro aminopeptidase